MRSAVALLLAVVFTASGLAFAATGEEVLEVTEKIICYCGCSGLTVAECACGTADAIRARIAGQIDGGLTPAEVVDVWVEEHGEQILAVPTREGFNLVGWVMPFVATAMALALLTVVLVRRRHRDQTVPATAPDESDQRYLERIDQDMRGLRP